MSNQPTSQFRLTLTIGRLGLALLLAAALWSAWTILPVQAATFDLTGSCSVNDLKTAIDNANANGEADTIILDESCVYNLTASQVSALGPSGLIITSDITITGNGAKIRRNSGGNYRLFYVGATGDLTLNDVTLDNGSAIGGDGGNGVTGSGTGFGGGGGGGGLGGNGANGQAVSNCTNISKGGGGGGEEAAASGTTGGLTTGGDGSTGTGGEAGDVGGGGGGGGQSSGCGGRSGGVGGFGGGGGGGGNATDGSAGGFGAGGGGAGLKNSSTDSTNGGSGGTFGSNGQSASGSNRTGGGGGGAAGLGGALIIDGGAVVINRSTLMNNVAQGGSGGSGAGEGGRGAGLGGAIFIRSGALTVTNSTFTSNSALQGTSGYSTAQGRGAAVFVYDGMVTLNYNTISDNTNTTGGTVYLWNGASGVLHMTGNIIANTAGGDDCIAMSLATNAFNLIQDNTCSPTVSGDPLLETLGDYGGDTQTMALGLGSPAIDQISSGSNGCNTTVTTDQRGVARPQQGLCDIGAFESQGYSISITGGNNQSTYVNTAFAEALEVTLSRNDPNLSIDAGQIITFTGPASGAGIDPSPVTAATNSSGVASVTVTANGIAGSYSVDALSQVAGIVDSVSFTLTNFCPGDTLFVNQAAVGSNDGYSWSNAFTDLQDGLSLARACGITEVWVATGVYTPGTARSDSFSLVSGIEVYGGFAGGEALRAERDWETNVTVLSGDIDGDDTTDANGVVTTTTHISGSNSYHVVTGSGADSTAVLDGFTITAGQANGSNPDHSGGGFYCDGSGSGSQCSPSLSNVTFSGNLASENGGAIYNDAGSSGDSSPSLTNVTFSGNSALTGGAIYNDAGSSGSSSPSLTNVIFSGNSALGSGGAMYNDAGSSGSSSPSLTNVTFSGNSALGSGGAMYNNGSSGSSSPSLSNVILWNNTALSSGSQIYNSAATPSISYSLIQSNTNSISNTAGSSVTYGPNILTTDPLFIDADGADNITGTLDDDLRLSDNSPAIDAGDNDAISLDTDLDGNDRFYDDTGMVDTGNGEPPVVDMGAYEKQSHSPPPDIALIGNGQVITNGDTSPNTLNDTDFGAVTAPNTVTHTFTISNGGTVDLTLNSLSLADGSHFAVTQPATTTVGAGQTVTFTITFSPSYAGVLTDTLSLVSNDPDETHYTFVVSGTGVCPHSTIYVNQAAPGPVYDGSSWGAAYRGLMPALNDAAGYAAVCAPAEIWVAKGTYFPGRANESDRSLTFNLSEGVQLYGGFAGGETQRDQRDWETNVTVLTGDYEGNDITDSNDVVTDTGNIVGDNRYHVVTADGTSDPIGADTVLDGFTITAGEANSSAPNDAGGGFYCNGSGGACNLTLSNLVFAGNRASNSGGALYNLGDSGQSSPSLTHVTFYGNEATRGGAIYNDGEQGEASPSLVNVAFVNNEANFNGGAMGNQGSSGESNPSLVNVTFYGNTAINDGGAMSNEGNSSGDGVSPTLVNVILWGNSTGRNGHQLYNLYATPVISYSLVQSDTNAIYNGTGATITYGPNILTGDPLFVDAAGDDLRLDDNSPAIDAGDNDAISLSTDLDGNPRFYNDLAVGDTGNGTAPIVDMGAYERQSNSGPVPDITISGNGQEIANGDASPSALDDTDFGTLFPGQMVTHTLTISNDGELDLTLDGSPAVTLTTGGAFTVTQPTSTTLAAGESDTFVITFAPQSEGTFTDTVTIANNDPDENPHTFVISGTGVCPGALIYVDQDAVGNNTGDSWTDAFTDLQDGLSLAYACGITEVWVATGVYTPGTARSDSFNLVPGVALYGGFDGTESERDARDPDTNITVLSGDIAGDDITDSNGVVTDTDNITGTNSYHVVYADGTGSPVITESTVLDGFIITAGQANGSGDNGDGGGFYCNSSNLGSECSPSLTNVTFSGNSAASGGAMYNYAELSSSNPSLTNVTFSDNSASNDGGAIYNFAISASDSSPILTNVTFSGNSAASGGAMYNYAELSSSSSPSLTNVTFSGNSASYDGGAIYNYGYQGESSPSLTNVTFSGNSASSGGAMYNYAEFSSSSPSLSNVILWNNTASSSGSQIYNSSVAPVINYSLVQGGDSGLAGTSGTTAFSDGTGNINADPLFVDAAGTDGITGTLDDDLRLLPGSPAIDSGDNSTAPAEDINGVSRPVNGVVDMGAYESQGFRLSISGGDNQSTATDTAFAEPLEVTASSAAGEPVGPGGVISFTAPSSGAGVTTPTLTATTNASGVASVTVTANSTPGSYQVTAAANGVAGPATFTLTNTGTITLSLAKSVELVISPAEPGDAITYTIVISNSGNEDATGVTVEDTLPTGVDGQDLSWSGTVTAGEALTFTLAATVTDEAGYGNFILNTATYSHTSGSGSDTAGFSTTADTTPPTFAVGALITPTNGVQLTDLRPTFDWEDAVDNQSGVVSYTLLITGSSGSQEITTTVSSYTPSADFATGVYTWTVRAHDAAGNASDYVIPVETFEIVESSFGTSVYLPLVVKEN